MSGQFRRLLGAFAICILIMGTVGVSAAQDALPTGLQQTLTEAAEQGDDALLRAVQDAVAANPELAQAIVDAATQLNPALGEEIVTAAVEAGGDIEIVPAAGPALFPVLAGLGLLGGGAAAAGGGGGGGTPAILPEPEPEPTPGDFETAEYNAQAGLALINASDAYARGLTGAAIIIGLLDSGLDVTHPEFEGRIAPGGFDFVDGVPEMSDPNGHGTHVGGIIAANRDGNGMHGVAYDALLLPIRIIDETGLIPLGDVDLAAAIDHAVANGAVILNNSWGSIAPITAFTRPEIEADSPELLAAVQRAVDSGTVIVFAAGNGALLNGVLVAFVDPNIQAGLPFLFPEFEELWVAVIAVDLNGAEPLYTNRCGVAAAWCITAPGGSDDQAAGGVFSTEPGGGYDTLSGTSMAAPHVSGSIAVLMQLFPELTPQAILDRLFETANSTGLYADATIFGHGLLDLEKATRPVGVVAILTGSSLSGPVFDLAASSIELGPAFGDGLKLALAGTQLTVFDKYRAGFAVDLGALVRPASSRPALRDILRGFGNSRTGESADLGGRGEAVYAFTAAPGEYRTPANAGSGQERKLSRFSLTVPRGDSGELRVGYNVSPALDFGLYGQGRVERNTVSSGAFRAPHLSFAEEGYSASAALDVANIGTVRVGSFSGRSNASGAVVAFGSAVEISRSAGGAHVSFLAGSLLERETLLGSRTEGAFDLGSGTPTYFAGFSAEVAVTSRFSLAGSFYGGLSYPTVARGSLFTNVSAIETRSFSLGLLGRDILKPGDRLGFVLNQPLRVTRGEAELTLATGRDRDGNVFQQAFAADLTPEGREVDFEAFYRVGLAEQTTLTTSAMLRTQPGHVRGADSEGLLLLLVEHKF